MKKRLRKLAEECGELTQAAIKLHHEDSRKRGRLLVEEAGDVIAQITKLVDLGVISKKKLKRRIKEKL
jgi:NTP pyrophosphatase (non-canonical NTP hydrolase)